MEHEHLGGDSYPHRMAAALLPLSREQHDLRLALLEWVYRGKRIDLGEPEEVCELCGQQGLRFIFEIVNVFTGNAMWVGSVCIIKFTIHAFLDGKLLSKAETQKAVEADLAGLKKAARELRLKTEAELSAARLRAETAARVARAQTAVAELATRERLDAARWAEEVASSAGCSPRQLNWLFWRFDVNRVAYSASDFRVECSLPKVLQLQVWQIHRMLPAMPEDFQKRVLSRVAPPSK